MNAVEEWVPYRRGTEILDLLTQALSTHTRPSPDLYILVGPPNNGKTAIADELCRRHPADVRPGAERSHIPVVSLDMPPRPNVTSALIGALRRTGAPAVSCPEHERLAYLSGVLRAVATRMVVLDDAQHILAGMPAQRRLFVSFWMDVASQTEAALLLIGTPQLLQLGPAIDRGRVLSLQSWPLDDQFASMARTFQNQFAPGKSLLNEEDIAVLHSLSAGRLGALVALIAGLTGSAPMLNGELHAQVPLELRFRQAEDAV